MSELRAEPAIMAHSDVREYFQTSISDAIHQQGLDVAVETAYYLVNLLTSFLRTECLFTATPDGLQFKPLAHLYSDALASSSALDRCRTMRRMGDMALFVAGVFSYSLSRKLVDVDYYIAMGGNAYAYLSAPRGDSGINGTYRIIYSELSTKFTDFVDVLARVNIEATSKSDRDILRLYELWVRTGSKRAENKLRSLGIEPCASLNAEYDT